MKVRFECIFLKQHMKKQDIKDDAEELNLLLIVIKKLTPQYQTEFRSEWNKTSYISMHVSDLFWA